MFAHLKHLLESAPPGQRTHLAREYLQARILSALQSAGAMSSIAFQGGTALRFLFDLDRFSEDLDFALVHGERYDLLRWLTRVKERLGKEALEPEIRLDDDRVVHAAWIRFVGLPHRLGLSTQATEILRQIDWRKVRADVQPFVEDPQSMQWVDEEALSRLLADRSASS